MIKLSLLVNHWNSGNGIRTGSGTGRGNLPFTLYLMPATTGFSKDSQGTKKYIDICKRNGLLPVGCGHVSHNCDEKRIYDEPCVPMPQSWSCHMMAKMKDATGWGNNIVAFYSDGGNSNLLWKSTNAYPSSSESLHPVCGKVTGGN